MHTPKTNVSERHAISFSLRRGFSRLQPRMNAQTSSPFLSRSTTACAISSSRCSLSLRWQMRREASRCTLMPWQRPPRRYPESAPSTTPMKPCRSRRSPPLKASANQTAQASSSPRAPRYRSSRKPKAWTGCAQQGKGARPAAPLWLPLGYPPPRAILDHGPAGPGKGNRPRQRD